MQKEFIGQDAIVSLQQVLIDLEVHNLFLVRGNKSYVNSGAESVLSPVFKIVGTTVIEFSGFSANPKMSEAEEGVKRFLTSGADAILVVGGGSAMDTAKLIRHYAAEQGVSVPLLAIPTTSGTGAEATHFSVIYVEGKKMSIEADDILPDYAFVYPPFTYSNSSYLTACTGFDALAQAIEASWNKNRTAESNEYASRAIAMLKDNLISLVQHPTPELRDIVAEGSYWAGRAINITKTTAPHAFSYAFTSKCGYPHGHAVALTFPYFAMLNTGRKELLDEYRTYVTTLGLSFHGTNGADMLDLLHEVNLQRLANNPVEVGEKQILELKEFLENCCYE